MTLHASSHAQKGNTVPNGFCKRIAGAGMFDALPGFNGVFLKSPFSGLWEEPDFGHSSQES